MVKITFETHLFEWNGEIYIQGEGCPAGLRTSGPISRIVMDYWVKEMKLLEEKANTLAKINPVMFSNINVYLLKKYVDDILTAGKEIKLGTFWDSQSKSLQWSPEKQEADVTANLKPDERSLRLIAEMGSSILECLEFTYDTPSQNPNLRMPVLTL